MIFPIAVASEGPAITGIPIALDVHWLSNVFFEPPPITCSFSIGNGARPDENSFLQV
jgi:hypothetical protein